MADRVEFDDIPNGLTATFGDEINSRNTALKTAVNASTSYKGPHNSATAYFVGDEVDSASATWVALLPNTNVTPTEGATWHKTGATTVAIPDASTTVKGAVKLATAPASPTEPIAVGTNDSRMANARTPTAHASTHTNGTDDIQLSTDAQKGLMSAADHTAMAAHHAAAAPHSGHLKADGSVALTADQSAGGFKITNLANGSAATDAATKQQVDAVALGYKDLANAKVMSTANITLSGTQTIATVALVADDRVLLTGQVTQAENGVWLVKAGAWDRPTDYDTGATPVAGSRVFVTNGSPGAGQSWSLLTSGAVIDTNATAWTQTGAAGTGEANTASNVGSEGTGSFKQKSGVNLEFYNHVSTSNLLTIALNAGTNALRYTVNAANFLLQDLGGLLTAVKGGTGQSTYTIGDTLYSSAANVLSKLTGNATTTKKFLAQTGDGTDSAAPEWTEIDADDLPVMGASGAGHAPGAVPDTPAVAGISKYLREDGTWVNPSIAAGAGDVVGPASATDNALAAFDGITGELIKERVLVAGDIPSLDAAKVTSGVFGIARLATGTPDGTKFVRDDGTLAVPAGSGGGSSDTRDGWLFT